MWLSFRKVSKRGSLHSTPGVDTCCCCCEFKSYGACARYSPETLADTTKMANLVAKYNKNPDQVSCEWLACLGFLVSLLSPFTLEHWHYKFAVADKGWQATQGSFEAKTFSALHGKYNTGAMGSVVSPVTGGIDAAGALPEVYR